MFFKNLVLTTALAFSSYSFADLNVAFGSSVPKDNSGQTHVAKSGISRNAGGERIVFQFRNSQNIERIRLTGFSASRAGRVLVREVKTPLGSVPSLSVFKQVTAGNPENYKDLVRLSDSQYVETVFGQPVKRVEIVVEGFSDNDAALLVNLTLAGDVPLSDFVVRRKGGNSGERIGSFFDESDYKDWKGSEVQDLYQNSLTPTFENLVNKTFVCTEYTRIRRNDVDFKTRHFFSPSQGVLQSTSDLSSVVATWIFTQEGLKLPTERKNGCGTYVTQFVLRISPSGNLVSEHVVDRRDYLARCVNKGYDYEATLALLNSDTYTSVTNPSRYRTVSYEFCRPANL